MSLRIWLPLNGSLKNQGLDKVTVTNNGATIDNNGKIGKCYSFDGSTSSINTNINIPNFALDKTYSITCWVCPSGTSGQKPIIGIGSDWSWTIFQQNTDLRFVQWDESGSRWGDPAISGVFSANTWVHIGVVWNQGVLLFYKNGEKIYEWTAPTSRTIKVSSDTVKIGGNIYAWGNNYFNGKLNDVRIYDHCLSPMEIKEISKGLILHYPLNRDGIGQNNIIKNSDKGIGFISSDYGSMTTHNFDSATGIGRIEIISDTGKWNRWRFGGKDLETNPVELTSGITTYTFSSDIRVINYTTGTIALTFDFRTNNVVHSTAQYILTNAEIDGQWHRVSASLTTNKQNDTECLFCITSKSTVGNIGMIVEYKHFKLEMGSIATPWCPNSTDSLATLVGMNTNVVKDISGYQNNGIVTGTVTYNTDTPKYHVSTEFDGTNYIIADSPSTEGKTLSAWVKTNSTGNRALIIDYKSGLGIGFWSNYFIPSCNASITTTYSFTDYVINQWNHIIITKPTSSSVLCYINGKLQDKTSHTDRWSTGVIDKMSIASRPNGANPTACQISDVRIYSTALSADEVKELYENNIVN